MSLRTLNYGDHGIVLIMGNAGFCPSAESKPPSDSLNAFAEVRALLISRFLTCAGLKLNLGKKELRLRLERV